MVQVFVTVPDAGAFQRDLAAAQRDVPDSVHDAMESSLLLIERDARANVRQDTRALMGSITPHISTLRGSVLEGKVGPSKRYGYWVEYGRKPNRKPPPLAPIRAWAVRHGIQPAAAFLIARAIGRRGIGPRPFMAPAFEKNERRIVDLFQGVTRALVARLGKSGTHFVGFGALRR